MSDDYHPVYDAAIRYCTDIMKVMAQQCGNEDVCKKLQSVWEENQRQENGQMENEPGGMAEEQTGVITQGMQIIWNFVAGIKYRVSAVLLLVQIVNRKCEFIKNSVVLELRVIYNIGVVGCLLEDDYIHRYDYQIQKEEDL